LKTSELLDTLEKPIGEAQSLVQAVTRLRSVAQAGACSPVILPVVETVMAAALAAEETIRQQAERIDQLESLSVTDELTGLFNRRGFEAELRRTLARAERNGECGLLVMCDLDRFKPINDTYGHRAGDIVLQRFGAVLAAAVRRGDIVGRLGGDEFGLILGDAAPEAVSGRVAPLRARLSGLFVEHQGIRIPVSASLGYAAYGPNSDAETLWILADKALYRDKERGATT